jgi:hypothetical protein
MMMLKAGPPVDGFIDRLISQRQTLDYLCIQAEKIKDAYMRLEL